MVPVRVGAELPAPRRHRVDARNLLCPLPVIRAQDRAAGLAPGDLVEVVGTDPGMLNDVPAWCRINGHRVLKTMRRGGEVMLLIELGGGEAHGS